jgi:hypothetical protein
MRSDVSALRSLRQTLYVDDDVRAMVMNVIAERECVVRS